jgi:hypothetical protein
MTQTFRVSTKMAANALRLCEVTKKNGAKRNYFLEFRKTAVVRRVTGGRTLCNSGAAAARCTKGERGEAFVQRFRDWRRWRFSPQMLMRRTNV